MNDEMLLKLITKTREVVLKDFLNFSRGTHTELSWSCDMVLFWQQCLHTRKINDWGRDEDTDEFIGITETGWCKYELTLQCGAGETEIIDQNLQSLSDSEVFKLLKNCNLGNYLKFIDKCNSIIKEYKNHFSDLLS